MVMAELAEVHVGVLKPITERNSVGKLWGDYDLLH